ncbi:Stigma-specific protein [Trema orientale]|uniref:Stigma-specific protein n=1 Tax=Trema orientale TaxID=63057 RepID=A0A2P5FZJ3_TREOI|nr:Stigma-specific protein [Trema orientale]
MSFSNDKKFHENDNPIPNPRSRSRFLGNIIKEGSNCAGNINVCNGVSANKGKTKSLLFCCKTHCRNVLGDFNNCGGCGRKCRFGERCCDGRCTVVLSNAQNCGKCGRRCKAGVKCQYGFCGYA